MTDETKKLFDAPWSIYLLDDVGDANGNFVCSCETPKMANRLARLPQLYDALLAHLSATCIRCKRRNCKFDKESFIQNEGCGCCEGIFQEQWKLLRKVSDGE